MKPAAVFASFCFLIVGCGGGGGGGTGGNGPVTGDLASAGPADLTSAPSSDLASGGTSTDMAGGGSGLCCGQPGDKGNELGVGEYCTGFTCTGMANLCATLGDPKLHFCTMTCTAGGNCGTGATCQCQGGQCGCFPDSCMNMPSTC